MTETGSGKIKEFPISSCTVEHCGSCEHFIFGYLLLDCKTRHTSIEKELKMNKSIKGSEGTSPVSALATQRLRHMSEFQLLQFFYSLCD